VRHDFAAAKTLPVPRHIQKMRWQDASTICDTHERNEQHAYPIISTHLTGECRARGYSEVTVDSRSYDTRSMQKNGRGVNIGPVDVRRRARSDQRAAALLDTALRRQDSAAFLGALNLMVRAHGYAAVAQKTGLNRTWLYKAISPSANLGIRTVVALLAALGLRLRVEQLTQPPD
jgi:probable addiction module antidote protein